MTGASYSTLVQDKTNRVEESFISVLGIKGENLTLGYHEVHVYTLSSSWIKSY